MAWTPDDALRITGNLVAKLNEALPHLQWQGAARGDDGVIYFINGHDQPVSVIISREALQDYSDVNALRKASQDRRLVDRMTRINEEGRTEAVISALDLSPYTAMASVVSAVEVLDPSLVPEMANVQQRVMDLDLMKLQVFVEQELPPPQIEIYTELDDGLVHAMAKAALGHRKLDRQHAHEKSVATIQASGPAKAEVVKWGLWVLGLIVVYVLGRYFGS